MRLTPLELPFEIHGLILGHCDAQTERSWRSTCRLASEALPADRLKPHQAALQAQSVLDRFNASRLWNSSPAARLGQRIQPDQIGGQAQLDHLFPSSSWLRTTIVRAESLSRRMASSDGPTARSILTQAAAHTTLALHQESLFKYTDMRTTPWQKLTNDLMVAWASQLLAVPLEPNYEAAFSAFKEAAIGISGESKFTRLDYMGNPINLEVGEHIDDMVDDVADYGRGGMLRLGGGFFREFNGKTIEQANEIGMLVALPMVAFREAVAPVMANETLFRTQWNEFAKEEPWGMYCPYNPLQNVLPLPLTARWDDGTAQNEYDHFMSGVKAALDA